MPDSPTFGLLLDVDGPISSPVSRTMAIDSIRDDLVALANAGIPVIFNTGRSDAFLHEVVIGPMRAAGLLSGTPVFGVGEKGAIWFELSDNAVTHIDEGLCTPPELAQAYRDLIEERFAESMFFDETKLSMISLEQRVEVESSEYLRIQRDEFMPVAQELLDRAGLSERFRLDPSIISVDVENVRVGKDLGAKRALALLAGHGIHVQRWYTAGDSRTDYDMADYLHEQGYLVSHLDVRPADGVPEKPYEILCHEHLIHDEAAAVFLTKWRAEA